MARQVRGGGGHLRFRDIATQALEKMLAVRGIEKNVSASRRRKKVGYIPGIGYQISHSRLIG
jgi:hypothetical protein